MAVGRAGLWHTDPSVLGLRAPRVWAFFHHSQPLPLGGHLPALRCLFYGHTGLPLWAFPQRLSLASTALSLGGSSLPQLALRALPAAASSSKVTEGTSFQSP